MNLFKYISLAAAVSALPLLFSSCSDEEDVIEFPTDTYVFGTANIKVTNTTLRSLGGWDYNHDSMADDMEYFGVAWTNPEEALQHGFLPRYGYDYSEPMAEWRVFLPYTKFDPYDSSAEPQSGWETFDWNNPYNWILTFFDCDLVFTSYEGLNVTTTLTFPDGSEKVLNSANPSCTWAVSYDKFRDGLYGDNLYYNGDAVIKIVSKGKEGSQIIDKEGEISIRLNSDYAVKDGVLYDIRSAFNDWNSR